MTQLDNYSQGLIYMIIRPESFKELIAHFGQKTLQWDLIEKLIVKGLVFRRVVSLFRQNQFEIPEKIIKKDECEEQRIRDTLEVMKTLSLFCTEENIPHIYTKAFQHFPDMGHDIDLLVIDPENKLSQRIQSTFGLKEVDPTFTNRLSNKIGFFFPNNIALEIHNGRTGHIGEHVNYVKKLIERSKKFEYGGFTYPIPCETDMLVIQIMQRVYGHFGFRLTDIINGMQLLKSQTVNRNEIEVTVNQLGIALGY